MSLIRLKRLVYTIACRWYLIYAKYNKIEGYTFYKCTAKEQHILIAVS
jgi:hypothetical protein